MTRCTVSPPVSACSTAMRSTMTARASTSASSKRVGAGSDGGAGSTWTPSSRYLPQLQRTPPGPCAVNTWPPSAMLARLRRWRLAVSAAARLHPRAGERLPGIGAHEDHRLLAASAEDEDD